MQHLKKRLPKRDQYAFSDDCMVHKDPVNVSKRVPANFHHDKKPKGVGIATDIVCAFHSMCSSLC